MVTKKTLSCISVFVLLVGQSLTLKKSKCLKNGLYEHPTDCNKFYSCAPFGPVLMHCPDGLHFNSQSLVCDWPQNAKCEEKSTDDAENNPHQSCPMYPHPEECNKFYLCSPSGPVTVHCPERLHFNPQLLVCDWPQTAGCIQVNNTSTSTGYPATVTEKLTINPITILENIEGDLEGISTVEVPGTTKSTLSTIGQSDSNTPADHTSVLTTIIEEQSTFPFKETTVIITSTENYETFESSDTSAAPIPSKSNSTSICKSSIWPHPDDCSKFFRCGATGDVEMVCPEQLHFNPVLLVCDWPHNAGCKEVSNVTPEMITTEALTTTPITTSFSETATTENMSESTSGMENLETTTIEDLNNSTIENLLLSTDGHTETAITARETTTKELELSSITTESRETTFISTTIESATTFQSNETTELCKSNIWPHPHDCTKFFMCDSTGTVEMFCPERLHFNPVLSICDWPHNAGCKEDLNVTPEITTTEFATESSTTTPTTTSFTETVTSENISKSTFDMENLETTTVEELNNSTTENLLLSTDGHTETTITAEENTTKELELSSITAESPESTIIESTTTFQSNDSTELCKSSIWPHPNDCTKFFMCSATGAVEKVCPEPLHFNPLFLACDWPHNTGCRDGPNVTPEITTTEFATESSTITPTTTSFSETAITENMSESTLYMENLETTTIENLKNTTNENPSTDGHTETTFTTLVSTTEELDLISTATKSPETMFVSTTIKSTTTFQSNDSTELCKSNIWPHPSDCTKFFICGSTGAVEMVCPEQLHFNPVLSVCDWPHNAGCKKYLNVKLKMITTEFKVDASNTTQTATNVSVSTIGIDSDETIMKDLDKSTIENMSSTETAASSILTTEENTINTTTQELETTFNSTSQSTTTLLNSNSMILCKAPIWSHPDDCKKFFMCGSTGAVEVSCPEQLYFNQALLVCDWDHNARCKNI